ncbi:hypothetical protein AGMMS49944_10220 [Spirochaetia bacterium]|nr:hypothetical protein AGMMS49944_10220 [Spirochaetia bacterium]
MTMEMNVDIPPSHRLLLEVPMEVPTGKAKVIFAPLSAAETECADAEYRERLKNLDTPLRRKYPTLISMIGSCKGLDTMEAYFERKAAEKEREQRQERRYEEET